MEFPSAFRGAAASFRGLKPPPPKPKPSYVPGSNRILKIGEGQTTLFKLPFSLPHLSLFLSRALFLPLLSIFTQGTEEKEQHALFQRSFTITDANVDCHKKLSIAAEKSCAYLDLNLCSFHLSSCANASRSQTITVPLCSLQSLKVSKVGEKRRPVPPSAQAVELMRVHFSGIKVAFSPIMH